MFKLHCGRYISADTVDSARGSNSHFSVTNNINAKVGARAKRVVISVLDIYVHMWKEILKMV